MLQNYWTVTKWFLAAVFVIAAVQSGLIFLGIYAPPSIDPLGVLKVLVVAAAVWRAVRKFDYTPQKSFISGAFLFIPTLLFLGFIGPKFPSDFGFLLEALSLIVFAAANFFLYGFVGLLTAVVAKKNALV